jgi:hypothetical protein
VIFIISLVFLHLLFEVLVLLRKQCHLLLELYSVLHQLGIEVSSQLLLALFVGLGFGFEGREFGFELLEAVLADLQDLFELFLGVGERGPFFIHFALCSDELLDFVIEEFLFQMLLFL